MRKVVTVLILIIFCISCKRFDSNKLNHQLIQGGWNQVQIIYPHEIKDSLVVENTVEETKLRFTGDSCIEEMLDVGEEKLFTFQIKDYILRLEEKDVSTNYLEIVKLTKDSLVLQTKYQRWKYTKIR